ncbi:hypothetical protein [Streptomyces sp. DH-12]|uniref:hypothetical protein n=1 Tax=Streptomyces sp. DH-12 TaxID=2072509 RepID=UPI001F531873|nr:hypothetical protein [Streptomyces sp. DH-12]
MAAEKTETVRTAYLEGRSIAALTRDHGVSRGAIRTAVADLLPDHTAVEEVAPAPELPVTLDMPGKVVGGGDTRRSFLMAFGRCLGAR